MAHPSVIINGVTYSAVPQVQIPKSPSGTATFWDATDMTIAADKVLSGFKGIGASGEVTGNIASKAAATITPTAASQTISSSQYLSGAQTIEAVVCKNLSAQNIASGVVVKIGTASDDDSVTVVTGSLTSAVISQDGTTKVLSIS